LRLATSNTVSAFKNALQTVIGVGYHSKNKYDIVALNMGFKLFWSRLPLKTQIQN